MKKVEANLIKGPHFELVEEKAYVLLHDILLEKAMQQSNKEEHVGTENQKVFKRV